MKHSHRNITNILETMKYIQTHKKKSQLISLHALEDVRQDVIHGGQGTLLSLKALIVVPLHFIKAVVKMSLKCVNTVVKIIGHGGLECIIPIVHIKLHLVKCKQNGLGIVMRSRT